MSNDVTLALMKPHHGFCNDRLQTFLGFLRGKLDGADYAEAVALLNSSIDRGQNFIEEPPDPVNRGVGRARIEYR